MAFDVFISHSSKDKAIADAACATLERDGVRCWIAPRDIRPGTEWDEEIVRAIEECRVMVLILSSNANESRQIAREVKRAFNLEIPVLPLRVEDVQPTKVIAYYMSNVHWLDAITRPVEQHLARLARATRALLDAQAEQESALERSAEAIATSEIEVGAPLAAPRPTARPARLFAAWIVAIAAVLTVTLFGGWLALNRGPDKTAEPAKPQVAAAPATAPATPTAAASGSAGKAPASSGGIRPMCEEFQRALLKQGRRLSVACNSNTAPGFYWEVASPRIRPYGYYGMVGSGSEPPCKDNADVGKSAESVSFETSTDMWIVRDYYCRGNGPYGTDTKCATPDASGQVFNTSSPYSGVFQVTCRKQPA